MSFDVIDVIQINEPASHTRPSSKLYRKLLPALIASCFACSPVWANPTGAQVVAGQASISNNGNVLTVINTPGSIINWQSFSVNPGELTQFLQQSASSTVLNRIVGQNPTQLFGALQSNGKVYLINPNGILFGAHSQVNVGGLVASSLDISNADFQNGKLNFSGTQAGTVVNQGNITTPSGGQVYLIAPQVQNNGIITSPQGEVLLAAGHSVQLIDGGDPNIEVVISAPTDQALNLGSVVAQGGKIGIYGALVNQNGLVSANSAVAGQNGQIVFKASDTTTLAGNSQTTATGVGNGGNIYLLGNHVGLTDQALVDASGQTGGGNVLVGGDFHGANPAMMDATATYVGSNALIKADAIQSGSGGNIAVWSNQQTQMYGNISAQGGAQSGNGGFVETSSKNALDFQGFVDLRAPMGVKGTLLLDPDDLTIDANPTTATTTASGPLYLFNGSGVPSDINVTTLQNLLASESVSIVTGGNITVAVPVVVAPPNTGSTLALTAGTSGTGSVIFSPGGSITANGSHPLTLSLDAPGIDTSAGSITSNNGSVTLASTAGNVVAGTINAGSGTVTINSSGSISGGTISGAAFLANSNQGMNVTTNVNSIQVQNMGSGAAGNITLANGANTGVNALEAVNSNGNIAVTIAGALSFANNSSFVQATNGNVVLSTQGAMALGLNNDVTATGSINLSSQQTIFLHGGSDVSGTSVVIQAQGNLSTDATSTVGAAVGSISLYSGYNGSAYVSPSTIDIKGALTASSSVNLNAGGVISYVGCQTGAAACVQNLYVATLLPSPPPTIYLTVTGETASNKTYDGTTTVTLTGGSLNGVAPGDTVIFSDAGNFSSKNVGNGVNVNVADLLTVTGDASGDIYKLLQPTITANITPIMLQVSGQSASSKTYNGNTGTSVSGGVLSGNVLPGEVVSLVAATTGSFANKNVGSNLAVTVEDTLSGANSGNYVLTPPNLTANITVATLTVSGQSASNKTYDGSTGASINGGVLNGIFGSDSVVLVESSSGTFATKNAGTNISVMVQDSLGGTDSGNYVLAPPAALTASILPKPITVIATVQPIVYNGNVAAPVSLGSLGVITGDNVTFTSTAASFANANVGIGKTVTVLGINATGTDAANYLYNNSATTVANIVPVMLTVLGETAQNKIYNGTSGATLVGGTLSSGVIAGDLGNVSLNQVGSFASANVGNGIAIVANDSLSGSAASNYALAQQPMGLSANIAAATTVTQASTTMLASNVTIEAANSPILALSESAVAVGTKFSGAANSGSKRLYCN